MNAYYNLYYIHWWSLVHFLMHYDNGIYKDELKRLVKKGAGVDNFEKYIGPVAEVQKQWRDYFSYKIIPEIHKVH